MHPNATKTARRWALAFLWVPLLLAGSLAVQAADAGRTATAPAKRELNVLFIGNSMTWWNHMPRLVAELAANLHPPVQVRPVMAVSPAMTLDGHLKEGSLARRAIAGNIEAQRNYLTKEMQWYREEAKASENDPVLLQNADKIAAQLQALKDKPKWDIVVIEPWGNDTQDADTLSDKVATLQREIAKTSPKARVFIYMVEYERDRESDDTLQTRMQVLREVERRNKCEVAPVALTIRNINKDGRNPEQKIGGVHPDLPGSYAIACTLFATIFKTNPVGFPVKRIESHQYEWGKTPADQPIDGIAFPAEPASFKPGKKQIQVQILAEDEMKRIQEKAWESLQQWQESVKKPNR
jgi:hypothetical protein